MRSSRPHASLDGVARLLWLSSKPARLATCPPRTDIRAASSGPRWKARQGKDAFVREAKVQGLKSRAAFKLLEVGFA